MAAHLMYTLWNQVRSHSVLSIWHLFDISFITPFTLCMQNCLCFLIETISPIVKLLIQIPLVASQIYSYFLSFLLFITSLSQSLRSLHFHALFCTTIFSLLLSMFSSHSIYVLILQNMNICDE